MTPSEIKAHLTTFTGTTTWTRYGLNRNYLMTDGILAMVETCGAGWLTDVIVSHQVARKVRQESFQVWKLQVNQEKHSAVVTATDGDDTVIARQSIEFTDFPLDEITVWVEGRTLLLPSEH